MTTNNTTNNTTPAFEVGAYYGLSVAAARAQFKIVDKMMSNLNETKTDKWHEAMACVDSESFVQMLTEPLNMKHVSVVATTRNDVVFIEMQISAEAVDAYMEFQEEFGNFFSVAVGMFNTLMQVWKMSGLHKAGQKFGKLITERK